MKLASCLALAVIRRQPRIDAASATGMAHFVPVCRACSTRQGIVLIIDAYLGFGVKGSKGVRE